MWASNLESRSTQLFVSHSEYLFIEIRKGTNHCLFIINVAAILSYLEQGSISRVLNIRKFTVESTEEK